MSATFLYFAYGSNLLTARLRERTPSARPLGVARLPLYALRWHKRGADGSGKCDIVLNPDAAAHVLGVVYEVRREEKPALDAAEALGIGYRAQELDVQLSAQPVRVWAYLALQTHADALPFTWYKALVIAGAREHRLDADYIRDLEAAAARPDGNLSRDAMHRRLLERV